LEYSFQSLYLCRMEKREMIIHTAMKLLTDNGVQATPMSAIAKAADTGMGTIYNYFPTKEDLINEVYLYIKREQFQNLMLPVTEQSIKKRFDHFYRSMILYFVKNPLQFRFMDQFQTSPILTVKTRKDGRETAAMFISMIEKGQNEGIFKPIPFNELTQFLTGGVFGFIRWVLTEKIQITQDLLDNQIRLAWDTVKQ
jgi:TetR/AcrR family transcriptional regulator, repressor of fatR-cypB operon